MVLVYNALRLVSAGCTKSEMSWEAGHRVCQWTVEAERRLGGLVADAKMLVGRNKMQEECAEGGIAAMMGRHAEHP